MARFLKRKIKNGWSYTATVRIKGYPSVNRTFDTKGEASARAAKTAEKIKAQKYNDPRLALQITLGVFAYLAGPQQMVDMPVNQTNFLLPGSAHPHIIKNVSETLAGRTECNRTLRGQFSRDWNWNWNKKSRKPLVARRFSPVFFCRVKPGQPRLAGKFHPNISGT